MNESAVQKLGSSAPAAIQAALDTWNAVQGSAVRFTALETTSAGIANDGQNTISFADTDAARGEVGARVAATHLVYNPDGNIVETDIILNPDVRFSTTLEANTYDLQAVITHELGHALGANHSTVVSSAMFWNSTPQNNAQSRLSADDAAFVVDVYPAAGARASYGTISGKATKNGSTLAGAAVIAVDTATGITIGGISSTSDGSYSLLVPPGNYTILAAPIAPLIPPAVMYGMSADQIDTTFKAAQITPDGAAIQVAAGSTVTAAVEVAGGASALSVEATAARVVSASGSASFGSPVVEAGKQLDFILLGTGLDGSLTEQNFRLIGAGASIHAGTLRVDPGITFSDGRHPLRFTIDTAASCRGTVSVFISKGADTALLAGGILVTGPRPFFTSKSLVNAASSSGGGVAPGELVSLYGTAIGPDSPAFATALDPATGALPSVLGDVTVTFDGVRAPLLVTSSGQVNLQVPYEVAGRANTVVVVSRLGVSSDPVSFPVLTSHPGLFVSAGTTNAVAVNQDGSINGPSSPAPKGSYVTFYGTGSGSVDPAVATGKPAPTSPLAFAKSVSVSIGGVDAQVYQGGVLSPGFVGLLQVAAQVPASAQSGGQSVTLAVNGQTSPAVQIYIK